MENVLKEIAQFLKPDARIDLKTVALQHIIGLTGTNEGIQCISDSGEVLKSLIQLLNDKQPLIAKDSSLCLINITSNEEVVRKILDLDGNSLVNALLKQILDKNGLISDQCCMILSNLTRPESTLNIIVKYVANLKETIEKLVTAFAKTNYNEKGAKLHYLGPVFSNITRNVDVRKILTNRDKNLIEKLLPFTEFKDSLIRRGGTAGTLKNLCFDIENHAYLLDETSVDILPRLLLPLAGNEELSDEENDKLPIDLQFLPEDKQREADEDIRCIFLEALTQLCAKRESREIFREKNVYVVLRELHKWERDAKVLAACENLVDILIRTEEEIGQDNLKDIEVPEELCKKFNEISSIVSSDQ